MYIISDNVQYRANRAIEKYASNYAILTRAHFYHVGASEKNRKPVLEAIVLNYNPLTPVSLEAEKQLTLFEKPKEQYVIYSSPKN